MIGVFDSGLGGLTVARAIIQALPRTKIIYFGDTARGPYGNKPPEVVMQYARENAQFLLKKKAQAIVVGCNTASAVAGLTLRKAFPGVPIFEVITPAVREALRQTRSGRIGIIGTRTTVGSRAYQKWCPAIYARACPMLVPLVETGRFDHPATVEVVAQYLRPLQQALTDTLILGCTHYPFLKPTIAKVLGPWVKLVDSAETVAKEVAQYVLSSRPKLAQASGVERSLRHARYEIPRLRPPAYARDDAPAAHQFYVSKKTPKFQELAEKWLGQKINLKLTPSP